MKRRVLFNVFKSIIACLMLVLCMGVSCVPSRAEEATSTVTFFEEEYRDAVYNINHISPLCVEMEDEEYVNPLTGDLTVSRTDLSLPGLNELDLNLTRYHSTTNEYLGELELEQPSFTYVYMAYCRDMNCDEHSEWMTYYYPDGNEVRIYDWLTQAQGEQLVEDYDDEYHGIDISVQISQEVSGPVPVSAPRIMGLNFEAKDEAISNLPYSLGANWAYDFPYVETVSLDNQTTVRYLHLGRRGKWKVDLDNINSGLEGYNGQDVKFVYDANNSQTPYSYYEKTGVRYYFGADGLVKQIKNQYGNSIDFQYDANGNMTKIIDSCGREVVFSEKNDEAVELGYDKGQAVSVIAPANEKTAAQGGIDEKTVNYYYEKVKNVTGIYVYKLVATFGEVNENYEYSLVPRRYKSDSKDLSTFQYNIGDLPDDSQNVREESLRKNAYFNGTQVLNSLYLTSINIEGSGYTNFEYTHGCKKKLGELGTLEFARVNRVYSTDDDVAELADIDELTGQYSTLSDEDVFDEYKYTYDSNLDCEFDGFVEDDANISNLDSIELTTSVSENGKKSTVTYDGKGRLLQTKEESDGNEVVVTEYTNNDLGLPTLVKTISKYRTDEDNDGVWDSSEIATSCYENYEYNNFGDVVKYYSPNAPRDENGSVDTSDVSHVKYCLEYGYAQKTPETDGVLLSNQTSAQRYTDATSIIREEKVYASDNTLTSEFTKKQELQKSDGTADETFVTVEMKNYLYSQPDRLLTDEYDYIDYSVNPEHAIHTEYVYGSKIGDKSNVVSQMVTYVGDDSTTLEQSETTASTYDFFGNILSDTDELGIKTLSEYNSQQMYCDEFFESSSVSGVVDENSTVNEDIDTSYEERTEYNDALTVEKTIDQYNQYDISIMAPSGNEILNYTSSTGHLTLNKYDNNSNVVLEKVYVVKGDREVSEEKLQAIADAFYEDVALPLENTNNRTYHLYSLAEYVYNTEGELVQKKEMDSANQCISFEKYSVSTSQKENLKVNRNVVSEYDPDATGEVLIRQTITENYIDSAERIKKSVNVVTKLTGNSISTITVITENTYDDISGQLVGVKTTHVDNNGRKKVKQVQYKYDYLGNQTQEIREDGTSNYTEYNAIGQAVRSYDYNSNHSGKTYCTTTEYYLNGDVKKTIIPIDENHYEEHYYEYDAMGNIVKESITRDDGKIQTTEYEYDGERRPITVTNYVGDEKQYTQYLYDVDGNEIRRFTGLTEKLHIEFKEENDASAILYNEVVEEYQKGDSTYTVRVGFEEESHVQDYRVSKSQYDLDDKLTLFTDPEGRSETYTYDFMGNLTKTVDKEGNTTVNDYDSRQRLISQTVKDAEGKDDDIVTEYTYNDFGEVTNVNDKAYTFDVMSRITKIVDNGLLPNKTVTTVYEYRVDGVQTSVVIKIGDSTKLHQKYTYDSLDRLKKVIEVEGDTENTIVEYTYDHNGNRLSEKVGDKEALYSYNWNNQVVQLINKVGDSEVSRYNYTYSNGGYQDSKTETIANYGEVSSDLVGSKTTSYEYDLLGRLIREATGEDSISYEYDKNNNRSSMVVSKSSVDKITNYQYNKNDELLSETAEDDGVKQITNYWYDLNGNQIAKTYASVVTNEADSNVEGATDNSIGISVQSTENNSDGEKPQLNKYDALSRQVKVKIGADIYKYGYDENGMRTWKEADGEKTYFVWNGDQIVLELDENGDVNKKHVRGLTLVYSEDDNESTEDKVFYNFNAHGDVVQLLDEAGAVTKYYQYDSFGNEINEDVNDENPWRYCGEYYDKETGTIYLRARYYDPGYGRFTTRDTYTGETNDPLSLNLYTYCANEPVMHVDPSGHKLVLSGDIKTAKKRLKKLVGASSVKRIKTKTYVGNENKVEVKSIKKNGKYRLSNRLVKTIINSRYICEIYCDNWLTEEYDWIRKAYCRPDNYFVANDSINFKGSGVIYLSNNRYKTRVPVAIKNGNKFERKMMKTPHHITLAHELLHCYHSFDGTLSGRMGVEGHYGYLSPGGKVSYGILSGTINGQEEAYTVGLNYVISRRREGEYMQYEDMCQGDLTENTIRREHKLDLRCDYNLIKQFKEYYRDENNIHIK